MAQAGTRALVGHMQRLRARLGWWQLWWLFVLPPELRRPLPGLDALALRLRGHLVRRLGVERPGQPLCWLQRLFLLPPEQAGEDLLRPFRLLLDILGWLLTRPLALLRLLSDWLSRHVDAVRLGNRLDFMTLALPTLSLGWRLAIACFCLPLLLICVTTPLEAGDQTLFAVLTLLMAYVLSHIPGKTTRVFLLTLSVIATLRYLWWRVTTTMPGEALDLVFALMLFMAELYAVVILLLGYFQTIWPLNREPAPLPEDESLWPRVDIFIPTYNEPLKVLRPTVLAALGLDWPADRLTVWILDDGRRPEMRQFAETAGVRYLIRPDNAHAKAGNLNHALQYSTGDYIAIFDCDHIPTRTFLRKTMGWFLKDPKCAVVQTPHHFFSADPFRRNLALEDDEPPEDMLFHGLIQDGNDFWNATFFCGSCAVIKREPLLEVGGIAVETVTEDAHTALKLHRLGYTTAFINQPLAAGLATESLASHVGQRIRWARGMVQIFRTDNPLRGDGLTLAQRLCYSNSMLHFLYGIPRLVFLLAPMAYMFFGMHLIATGALAILAYIVPQLVLANLANSRAQGRHRHSFWSEVYETVLAWYIAVPTTMALINPRLGKFNVTSKGDIVDQRFYDWDIARPYIVLILINVAGLAFGVVRLFWWNSDEPGTVLLNLFWVLYNLVALGVAMGAARENKQVRLTHRVRMYVPAVIYRLNGQAVRAMTNDFSMGGLSLVPMAGSGLAQGEHVRVLLPSDDEQMAFNAQVMWTRGGRVGLRFENMTLQDERDLVRCTFSRPGAWDERAPIVDKPWQSLRRIAHLCWLAYGELYQRLSDYLGARSRLKLPHLFVKRTPRAS